MGPKQRKTFQIERYVPDDDKTENSKKWKKWKRDIGNLMDYHEVEVPAEKKKALLAHCGGADFDLVENAAEIEGADDAYTKTMKQIEQVYVIKKNRLFARYKFHTTTPTANQTTAEYENVLRGLAKDGCDFTDMDDQILDRLVLTCPDSRLQTEAIENSWDLKTFLAKNRTRSSVVSHKTEMALSDYIKVKQEEDFVRRARHDKPIDSHKNEENP